MQLKPIGSNVTEVTFLNGTIVLFSYSTPVAAYMGDGSGFIRTRTKWSVTTSKRINKWLAGAKAREVDQSVLDIVGEREAVTADYWSRTDDLTDEERDSHARLAMEER